MTPALQRSLLRIADAAPDLFRRARAIYDRADADLAQRHSQGLVGPEQYADWIALTLGCIAQGDSHAAGCGIDLAEATMLTMMAHEHGSDPAIYASIESMIITVAQRMREWSGSTPGLA